MFAGARDEKLARDRLCALTKLPNLAHDYSSLLLTEVPTSAHGRRGDGENQWPSVGRSNGHQWETRWPPVGRSNGRWWGEPMAAGGENRWPPSLIDCGTRWPAAAPDDFFVLGGLRRWFGSVEPGRPGAEPYPKSQSAQQQPDMAFPICAPDSRRRTHRSCQDENNQLGATCPGQPCYKVGVCSSCFGGIIAAMS